MINEAKKDFKSYWQGGVLITSGALGIVHLGAVGTRFMLDKAGVDETDTTREIGRKGYTAPARAVRYTYDAFAGSETLSVEKMKELVEYAQFLFEKNGGDAKDILAGLIKSAKS